MQFMPQLSAMHLCHSRASSAYRASPALLACRRAPPPQLYISQRKGRPVPLVATEASHGEGPRSLYISQRWLPLVLSIRGGWLPGRRKLTGPHALRLLLACVVGLAMASIEAHYIVHA